ncbi:MAG TPA: translation initiation factor IF-2 [Planctomycetota bacterium]|nr:translation initiation factor IF-2 [Planctomycetota bacterium]
MSKVRVYELAKDYGMAGPKMAELLRSLGFDNVKSHMAVLDTADQLQVVARLEAQGLVRTSAASQTTEAAAGTEAEPGVPLKKKTLPPPVAQPPKKKPLPEPPPPAATVATPPPPRVETPPPAEKPEKKVLVPPPTPEPVAQAPAPPAPPARPAAEAQAPAAEPAPAARTAPEPTPAPAPAPTAPPRAEPAAPAAAQAAPSAPAGAPAPAPHVKRLLVPQAKAQVVGRIELRPEQIRDAKTRSAPAADKAGGAAARLRRMALQNTQRPGMRPRGKGFAPPPRSGKGPSGRRSGGPAVLDPNRVVEIQPPVSVKALSEALGIKVTELLADLNFKLNIKGKTINSFLTAEEVELIGLQRDRNIKIVEPKEAEAELLQALDTEAADAETVERPPVVTFMGHVDHGKTSLLDALRKSDVAAHESGGITQHIGAYKVTHHSGAQFVVLDTPGHAAFTAMRARGARLTDIVVLVVAADDGVMPQTEEAIAHAKDAGVDVVVAINKCDKPGANPMQVMQQLAVKGLQPEEWGGDTQVAQVSALTGAGLDDLVEKIMLQAHLKELRARPSAPGTGVVIESKQSSREGVVLNVLVMDGTLRVRDHVLCGNSVARVRGLIDDHGRPVKEAGPGTPVTLLGIDTAPEPGEKFYVVSDAKKAREVAEERERRARALQLAQRSSAAITQENLSAHLAAQKANEIKIIVKADVTGSLEPIKKCLTDLNNDEVKVNIIHAGLGGITDSDVSLAEAGGAIIVGFHTAPEATARQHAERAGVDIRLYEVIYDLIDDIKKVMEGTLAPTQVEKNQGFAEVRAIFKSSRFGTIAGCYVTEGSVFRNSKVRLSRDGKLLYTGQVASLRREKDDVREVKAGFECGLTLKDWEDIKVGDKLEFYEVTLVKRTLS